MLRQCGFPERRSVYNHACPSAEREVGESMKQQLGKLPSDKARIRYIAEQTTEITGLHDFPQYLTLLFEIDSLILNDDRHLNNIAVLEQGGAYDYCPIFDNGAGLLSNMQVYNVGIEPGWLIPSVMSRPFNISFNRQMGTVRRLYGNQLSLPKFAKADIDGGLVGGASLKADFGKIVNYNK